MRPLPWWAACVVAGSLAGAPALAQPAVAPAGAVQPAATVALRDALEAAWQRSVAAREADGQRRRADAGRAAAGRFWAAPPSLALSNRDDRLQGNAGRSETEVGVAVPLWLPGQRSAQAGTAEALAAQAQAAAQVARLRLAGELREAAGLIAALQAEKAQTDAQAQATRQLADDVERRVRAGDLARADALAAQAEHWAATAAQADVQQRLQAARAHWALLTGLTAAPEPDTEAGDLLPAAVPEHPELQLAREATAAARQRLELLRRSRRDAPELSIGLRQDVGGRGEASQGSLVVGVRLPLGTDSRNQPLEAAALAELDIAQTHEQRLRERVASDATAARHALQAAGAQAEAEAARARLLHERAALIDKAFRAGEAPLPDLLRARAAAVQAETAATRHAVALGLARARLQQALGLLP